MGNQTSVGVGSLVGIREVEGDEHMSDHSCGYHCQHPECIKAQRDYLRDKYEPKSNEREKELLIMALNTIQMLTATYRKEHGLDGAWNTPLLKGESASSIIDDYLKCL